MESSKERLLLDAREELVRWATIDKGLGEQQVGFLLELLDRDVLLNLPCSNKVEKRDTSEGIRHLFYHHVSNILGWKERVCEGDPLGISSLLYSLVRQIWPTEHHANNEEHNTASIKGDGARGDNQQLPGMLTCHQILVA